MNSTTSLGRRYFAKCDVCGFEESWDAAAVEEVASSAPSRAWQEIQSVTVWWYHAPEYLDVCSPECLHRYRESWKGSHFARPETEVPA